MNLDLSRLVAVRAKIDGREYMMHPDDVQFVMAGPVDPPACPICGGPMHGGGLRDPWCMNVLAHAAVERAKRSDIA